MMYCKKKNSNKMNTALVAILILTCYLQMYQAQTRRARCYRKHVCGVNGKTYRNECVASRRGIIVACKRRCPCKPNCNCVRSYRPVCGWNGQTYGSRCLAFCERVGVRCPWPCPCFTTWN
ncbi:serine protease inhibitor dipetalogastin-like [Pecten maximus]|uniref:serine protease inhibitor dipetalogastin-like n=1 Tax=Pecten maximus TaxID=6579 RepID=UPI0014590783|nr:serine protease inhibitor dipetalogastin-like [Pecten maximus]